MSHIERTLLMRKGSLLRTSLHKRAIYDALIKGLSSVLYPYLAP